MTEDATSLRQTWRRGIPALTVDDASLQAVAEALFPGSRVVAVTPLSGGLANTNIRLTFDRDPGDVVLRLYQRDPREMTKEAALAARLDGRIPIARFLHHEVDPALLGAPFAVMTWIDGVTLDSALPDLKPDDLDRLGDDLGRILATIHGETFATAGFFDGALEVADAIDIGGAGLIAYGRQHLAGRLVVSRLGAVRARDLLAFIETHAGRLDAWTGAPCLAHADFNGSNILVTQCVDGVEIAAVLDWEFAFSGSPFFDLGNIARPPLGDNAGFVTALERGYRALDARLPENWPELARLADLTSWIDFATRPELPDSVLADVLTMIDRTIG